MLRRPWPAASQAVQPVSSLPSIVGNFCDHPSLAPAWSGVGIRLWSLPPHASAYEHRVTARCVVLVTLSVTAGRQPRRRSVSACCSLRSMMSPSSPRPDRCRPPEQRIGRAAKLAQHGANTARLDAPQPRARFPHAARLAHQGRILARAAHRHQGAEVAELRRADAGRSGTVTPPATLPGAAPQAPRLPRVAAASRPPERLPGRRRGPA
jgi:hypothetical protein